MKNLKLKAARAALDLSQQDLADKVGGIAFVREVYRGLGVSEALSAAQYEIVLNKGGPIYRP